MKVNCHVPITLRIVGSPTDEQLTAVGQALTRLVAARLAEAEQLLADRPWAAPPRMAPRERYDPDREQADGYPAPSYDDGGRPTAIVLRAGSAPTPRKPGRAPRGGPSVRAVTAFIDRGIVVLELDQNHTVVESLVYNGRPNDGKYLVTGRTPKPDAGGIQNANHLVLEWAPRYTMPKTYWLTVVKGRPGPVARAGSDASNDAVHTGTGGTKAKPGQGTDSFARQTNGPGKAKDVSDRSAGETGGVRGGDVAGDSSGALSSAGDRTAAGPGEARLTPEEEAVWRQIADLMRGASQSAAATPVEMVRLFQVLRSLVVNPRFGAGGESWIRFAHYLEQNRRKIEGYLSAAPGGKLTLEVLEKVVNDYGKFLATAPPEERPSDLTSLSDYDKEFRYDPGWQRLSVADRRLLLDYARLAPGSVADGKIDFARVSGMHKVIIALKASDTSILGAVGDAAKDAFTDAKFLITFVTVMGVYVGLWLTPDPTWLTKVAAGALTVALWTQFAIEDIIGLAVAWSDLSDECVRASTLDELRKAGDTFLRRIGVIGFDIILFVVTSRVGKVAGPKLTKIGAERGVARALAKLAEAEAKLGKGTAAPQGPAGEALSRAKGAAKGSSPTEVLDALNDILPAEAREGLGKFRGKAGDASVLKALEGQAARGADVTRFLTEQNMTAQAKEAARAELSDARLQLARARLIESETIKDPALRDAVRGDQYRAIRKILEEAGAVDAANIKKAIAARNLPALLKALKEAVARIRQKVQASDSQGALGESIQRALLRVKYFGQKGVRLLSNLAVVRRVGEFRSIPEWVAAEQARIRAENPSISAEELSRAVAATRVKLFEKDGKVYVSLGEVDAMAVEANPSGRLRPLEISEAKSGGESGASASRQLVRIAAELQDIGSGKSNAQIFELRGKKLLGNDVTSTFDLAMGGPVEQSTFGPVGKESFSRSLGFTQAELTAAAESLLRNLPPAEPAKVGPLTSPRSEEEEDSSGR